MNFRFVLLLLTTLMASFLYSLSLPGIEWSKCYGGKKGDKAYSIRQTNDDGYIIAGYSYSTDGDISNPKGGSDYWIVKLDSNGNIQWQKSYGGSKDDFASSIQLTNDGGYIVVGYSNSNDGDVSGHHGSLDSCDYWILKLNSIGQIDWQRSLGGSSDDFASSVIQTLDDGYIIAGSSYSNDGDATGNHGSSDFWIVKLNPKGEIDFQKSFGGNKEDEAYAIQQIEDRAYIIAGRTSSNDGDVKRNHGHFDSWIIKIAENGDLIWEKSLGGSSSDWINSIKQTNDRGYIFAGVTWSNDGDVTGNHGYSDYWVVKLDSFGSLQWQKCLGGGLNEEAFSIQQTIGGEFIISGNSCSYDGDVSSNNRFNDYWVVKLDSIGTIQWQESLGEENIDLAYSIELTKDGGYIIAGYSNSNSGFIESNHGGGDYWIIKLTNEKTAINDNPINNNISLSISPNPASDNISISFPGGINQTIHIYNSLGNEIKRFEGKDLFEKNFIDVSVEGFPSGIYYVMQDIGCLPAIQCLTKSFVVIR
jgi:hypothetical protein